MPHGTLANLATSAFIRTPPSLAARIVRCLLCFPTGKPTTVLDPTSGEGDLLSPCQDIPFARLYGVEISGERTATARTRLPQAELVTCAFEGVSIPKGSMSLVLANPPYFFQDGKRAEYRIIADAGTLLVPGGVMVAIIPARSAWDGTMIHHWCRWYDRVRVWKFPDRLSSDDEGAFEDFTQICVVGLRRAEPCDPLPEEARRLQGYRYYSPSTAKGSSRKPAGWESRTPPPELPISPIPDPYLVPECSAHPRIVVRHADESLLLTALERCGAHLSPNWQAATEWREEGLRQPPVMPLAGEAHVAAEVLTGLLDGEIVWGPQAVGDGIEKQVSAPYLLTAFVGQEWVSMPVEAEEREKLRERGVVHVAVRQWQDKPMLGVLNMATGQTRYEQGEAVFTFLQPWLSTLAARVIEKRQPLYRLDPADWELRVVSQFGRDKQLPHAAFPGLSLAQQHRVYAMGRALDVKGRTAIQGEPGTGKTRLAVATAARQAYLWRHRNTALFRQGQPQPAWVRGLRRAWLKNPRTLALLGLTAVREEQSGRIVAYRRQDGRLIPPEEAGPQALPVMVSTPKKVTKEYAAEVRAAWPEAEVIFLERHSDIPGFLQQCAESRAPAVIAIVSHSLTRAFGRAWKPVVREKRITRRVPVLEPDQALLPQLDPVYDERHVLTGCRWRASGKLYTQEVSVSHFFCPDCGGQIKATPGKLHEREERKEEEDHPLAERKPGGSNDEEDTENNSLEPVTSRTWFTLKPRWCQCRSDARNRPGPGNPDGRTRIRTPLWSDARLEAAQRKHPQLSFAAWSAAVERLHGDGCQTQRTAACASSAKGQAVSLGFGTMLSNGKARQNVESDCALAREPLPDSFSPYQYLYRFYRGCVALAVIDESHNGRGHDTDIAHAHHHAMLAAQTRMLTSGTHFGGDILGFYHYWLRFDPPFWRRLGLGWDDADKALSRYGVIQEWRKEYESDARRGSGQTSVQVSTIPAPGLSAKLIPYLLEDMVYLTVLDVGSHMPPRIEIPEIVSMRDADLEEALFDVEQARREATRTLAAFLKEQHGGAGDGEQEVEVERERLEQTVQQAIDQEKAVQAWVEPRHLAPHYTRLVRALDDLARRRNTAARLAKGTVPRWFAVLPCDRPFEVWETRRDSWGDTQGRHKLVETEQLCWEHLYPLERRLIILVQQELREGRRIMLYFDQNELRSMSRRLEWVLKEVQPWILPNSVAAEDRQQAILRAVEQGHQVVIVPYRRVNEGLNLQSGIDTIVWVEMALNLFMLDQASRRAWRLGKREEVRIYYMAYANTAGHTKLRKLGQQSGAAAAFAGEPARGALIEHAGADKTTLARLSSLLEQGEEDEEDQPSARLSGVYEVAEEQAALKAVFARRAEELCQALLRGRAWLGGVRDDLAERLTALSTCPTASVSVWAERPHPLALRIPKERHAAEQTDEQRELVIPHPVVASPVIALTPLSALPVPLAVPPPTVVAVPELPHVPATAVGSRAQVVFGRQEHIALTSRRTQKCRVAPRRRLPISERDIPSLGDDQAAGAEEQRTSVALPSLWDLLVAPTSEAVASTQMFVTVPSQVCSPLRQPQLWEQEPVLSHS
jgi:hypothetical protein